ncbi:MAG: YcxB family protein [Verrucomicrobiae bacterium]|nr:YcxB family protein [Verrucomicrobiae bacterium]NNJ44137.1 YcxB family protein [Akkermansiaceae bacterium]
MPDTIQAHLVFDEGTHLRAFRIHMWHRYRIWLMIRTALSITLLLAGLILLISRGPNPMPVLMLMIGTFALLRPMIWKIMHARNLRQTPGYGQSVSYTFTTEGVEINGEDRHGKLKWSDLLESVPHKRGLLLYHGKKSYTWIPHDAFDSPGDFQSVIQWADPSPDTLNR